MLSYPVRAPDLEHRVAASHLIVEPFLQFKHSEIYNPVTGQSIPVNLPDGRELLDLVHGRMAIHELSKDKLARLEKEQWIVEDDGELDRRFVLRYVSLEAHTLCNQACYFCPVSTDPREKAFMMDDVYRSIVDQLAAFRSTICAVFMMNYNEPTLDPRFTEHVRLLRSFGLMPAVNTNGTGLTPDKCREIEQAGGLRYLEINLSSLDRDAYERDRGEDHLDSVLRNLDFVAEHPIADRMEIAVLGRDNNEHHQAFRQIRQRYSGSAFRVRFGEVMDRAGNVKTGRRRSSSLARLGGCDNNGSRVIEHLHIMPDGKCVICCQDYFGKYVVGDLTKQRLPEVLASDRFAQLRRWTYGMEEAPADFLCRKCVFAVERPTAQGPTCR